jgi:CheY-like chemotaxis protein
MTGGAEQWKADADQIARSAGAAPDYFFVQSTSCVRAYPVFNDRKVKHGWRFLLVEDDETVRFLRRRELEKGFSGCEVTEHDSAEKALALSNTPSFAAVLTDYKLPGIDGIELIAQLRKRGWTCPLLLVTGSDDPAVHGRATLAGASRVLFGSRPALVEELSAVLSADQA